MSSTLWYLLLAIPVIFACLFLLYRKIRLRKFQQQCHHVKLAGNRWNCNTEVVIVGGGILGSALATVLAREGRQVTLIERDLTEPDRIVGELLQPGGVRALRELGLEDALKGIDFHTAYGYIIHDKDSDSSVALGYPTDGKGDTQTGRSFHHGRFVMGLRKLAINEPNVTVIEGTVQSLLENSNNVIIGVQYKDKQTSQVKTVRADITFVADGCFSKFRKDLVSSSVTVYSNFVGAIMHDVPQYKSGHAEIVLGSSGPILIYQISSTCTRILVDIPGQMPADMRKYMKETIAPQLPVHIHQPFMRAIQNDNLRSMPNSFLPPLPNSKPGVVILGDAYNMRHPLTGAGMSVALNDILLLRELLHDIPYLNQQELVRPAIKRFQWKRKISHSFVVNILAQALYALFSSPEGHTNDLRRACFQYFKLGGQAVSGPVGLLSVLKPHPSVLIGHFFAVAFYAIYLTLRKYAATLKPHWAAYKSFMILYTACRLIFPLIYLELESLIF